MNTIKKSGYSKKVFLVVSILMTIAFSYRSNAASISGIQISKDARQLIAPEGIKYQWFLDGKEIAFYGKAIAPEKSGEYMVAVTDIQGNVKTEKIRVAVNAGEIKKIYIIGDSTVANYHADAYPMTGWGQVLNLYLDQSKVQITNKAIGGRSSRSFYEEGRWTEVYNLLDSADYVFIQFGHNDRSTVPERHADTAQFKNFLRIYVNDTRAKKAIPVLISPMIMNAYSGDELRNVFTEGSNDYRGAMLEVAEELNVIFIDLNMKSYDYIKKLGQEYATYFIFMGLEPDEYPNYPDGYSDGTHFQTMGAIEMARLIVEGIKEQKDDSMAVLKNAINQTYSVNISKNIDDAQYITIPGSYPPGAEVTLKTRLQNGMSFANWSDDSGLVVSLDNVFIMNMEDKDTSFNAILKDCAGDTGGSATFDKCMICSGGSTGIPSCEVIFESEDACDFTGYTVYSSIGGITRKIVNTSNADSSPMIEYSIDATDSGTYDFALAYISKIEGEKLDIFVNDELLIDDLELEQGEEEWKDVKFELSLQQGINYITIYSTAPEGGIFYDMLVSYSTNLTEGSCILPAAIDKDLENSGMVYPNPSTREFIISNPGEFEFRIYNSIGVQVLQGICEDNCIVGRNLPSGSYFLQLIKDKESYIHSIHKF